MFQALADIVATGPEARAHAHLLLAHLASLLDGIEQGHLPLESASAVKAEWLALMVDRGLLTLNGARTAEELKATPIWNLFGASAAAVGDKAARTTRRLHKLSDARAPASAYGAIGAVTLAPLHHHVEAIRRGAVSLRMDHIEFIEEDDFENIGEDDLKDCAKALLESAKGPSGAGRFLKGDGTRTVWIAPLRARVATLAGRHAGGAMDRRDLTDLRDLLGLWAENGRRPPLAAFFLKPRSDVFAPNAVTARGYERFRHRPKGYARLAPEAGLTYNLNRGASRGFPGAAEVVAVGVTLGDMSEIVACGKPDAIDFTPADELKSHREYARNAAGRRSLAEILAKLEKTVP